MVDWYDQFVTMMDRAQDCKLNVVLLDYFNTDMQNTNSLFGLDQMITSPTRILPHSSTLIDHICTSDTSIVSNILVPATGIGDHFPVCCTLSVKTEAYSEGFGERAFLMDLHLTLFENMYNCSHPNVALSLWSDLILDVINKHVPLKNHQTLPPWLNTDIK